MFEVSGLLKKNFFFIFNTCVLRNGVPLVAFGRRKLEPMSIIPYYFEGSHGPANSLLESSRDHRLKTSYSTGNSRIVLGQNFIQEDPGALPRSNAAAVGKRGKKPRKKKPQTGNNHRHSPVLLRRKAAFAGRAAVCRRVAVPRLLTAPQAKRAKPRNNTAAAPTHTRRTCPAPQNNGPSIAPKEGVSAMKMGFATPLFAHSFPPETRRQGTPHGVQPQFPAAPCAA
ncbi:uncharacterized protein TM35_000831070 [Trypanosoma theileri]|uniref:Uncharacterized protein n=1 Tax=Trypanosoma theileri TaxID=67003 RepID=A0A1X0NFD7_9TRYP|nr:uncharacterized protein TM35_000831070 [Trypanosoma theileri]ORC82806.1 hypothetical protein TM35_000831070 [Trypanosoma theileri]